MDLLRFGQEVYKEVLVLQSVSSHIAKIKLDSLLLVTNKENEITNARHRKGTQNLNRKGTQNLSEKETGILTRAWVYKTQNLMTEEAFKDDFISPYLKKEMK